MAGDGPYITNVYERVTFTDAPSLGYYFIRWPSLAPFTKEPIKTETVKEKHIREAAAFSCFYKGSQYIPSPVKIAISSPRYSFKTINSNLLL